MRLRLIVTNADFVKLPHFSWRFFSLATFLALGLPALNTSIALPTRAFTFVPDGSGA